MADATTRVNHLKTRWYPATAVAVRPRPIADANLKRVTTVAGVHVAAVAEGAACAHSALDVVCAMVAQRQVAKVIAAVTATLVLNQDRWPACLQRGGVLHLGATKVVPIVSWVCR